MPERIQLRRNKGWRMPANTRVVTRSTIFGNPWVPDCEHAFWWPTSDRRRRWASTHRIPLGRITAAEAVNFYDAWLYGYAIEHARQPVMLTREGHQAVRNDLAARRQAIYERLRELRGKRLACWCPPSAPCHADVLLRLANA